MIVGQAVVDKTRATTGYSPDCCAFAATGYRTDSRSSGCTPPRWQPIFLWIDHDVGRGRNELSPGWQTVRRAEASHREARVGAYKPRQLVGRQSAQDGAGSSNNHLERTAAGRVWLSRTRRLPCRSLQSLGLLSPRTYSGGCFFAATVAPSQAALTACVLRPHPVIVSTPQKMPAANIL